jgi:hypothetical protein
VRSAIKHRQHIAAAPAVSGAADCFTSGNLIEVERCRIEANRDDMALMNVYCHDLELGPLGGYLARLRKPYLPDQILRTVSTG